MNKNKHTMLVAFYSKKQTRVGYRLSNGRVENKVVAANTWTIFEDLTDTSQITNTAVLEKVGVTTYAASFKGTPPFGMGGNVAIVAANTDTARVGKFSEFRTVSKEYAAEIAAGRVTQFDEKVERVQADSFLTSIGSARVDFLNSIADAKKIYEESGKGDANVTILQAAVQLANANFLNRVATLNANYIGNVFGANFDAETNSIIANRVSADRTTFGSALATAVSAREGGQGGEQEQEDAGF